MTIFKINPDDQSVRNLQTDNKIPATTGSVQPVNSTKPVQPSPEQITYKPIQNDPHKVERRHLDRRQSEKPVILDTRSPHDRRTKIRHGNSDGDESGKMQHGIDEEV